MGLSTDLCFLILHDVRTYSSHSFYHQLHLSSVTWWTNVNQRSPSLSEGLQVCVTGTRRVSDELSSGFFLSLMALGSACLQLHLKWAAATCLGLYSVDIRNSIADLTLHTGAQSAPPFGTGKSEIQHKGHILLKKVVQDLCGPPMTGPQGQALMQTGPLARGGEPWNREAPASPGASNKNACLVYPSPSPRD